MSQVIQARPSPAHGSPPQTLLLENGDRLNQPTFHKLYEQMPEDFRAELIQGRVYVSSPVRSTHGFPHALVTTWLGNYEAATEGVSSLVDTTAILDGDNEPQRDCGLIILPAYGGQTTLDEKDYIVGPSEFAFEIASSTVSYDLFDKREAYEQTGILEYAIYIVQSGAVCWFRLEEGKYVELSNDNGIFRSHFFPGLWLDSSALLMGKINPLLDMLRQGLASPEHADFVQKLQQRKSSVEQ